MHTVALERGRRQAARDVVPGLDGVPFARSHGYGRLWGPGGARALQGETCWARLWNQACVLGRALEEHPRLRPGEPERNDARVAAS